MTRAMQMRMRIRRVRRRIRPWRFKESYVNAVLKGRSDALYLEIGVRWGDSLRAVRAARKIGVDPDPAMGDLRANEVLYTVPSDEFFDEVAGPALKGHRIDAALVDGLHEFTQALRDVLNLERFMSPDGIIVIDDCNPQSAERASDQQCRGKWNGDVWKVVTYLREQRPDLQVRTVDADSGIGIVTGFGAAPPAVTESVVATYKHLEYSALESKRTEMLNLVSPGADVLSR